MFSIFSKNIKKKKSIQSTSDHSDSETVDDPGPSTSHSLCEQEQNVTYLNVNIDNENVCSSQILNLGLGDIENGPYRPILAVSTYYLSFISHYYLGNCLVLCICLNTFRLIQKQSLGSNTDHLINNGLLNVHG